MANLKNTTISDTGFLRLPTGSEQQRPTNLFNGQARINSDSSNLEIYQNNTWLSKNPFVGSVETPAKNAVSILLQNPTSQDGLYYIKNAAIKGASLPLYCDMTTDGGGWMHIATFSDNPSIGNQDAEESPWGYSLHRNPDDSYNESSNHIGIWGDTTGYGQRSFDSDFKFGEAWRTLPFTQILIKDQGRNLRNLFFTNAISQVNNALEFFGADSNTWVDVGNRRQDSTNVGFRNIPVVSFGVNDDVFGGLSRCIIGYGEPLGIQSGNQDRSMITSNNNNGSVSATQGIGVSRADGAGYQRYRDIDPNARDEPGSIGDTYNYTFWIR